tara:strand:- start:9721 stop:10098 length:378 start_codon:yes stop_codon:yes gene_type:complete
VKKPDNIVFNSLTNEYDAYKKEYPTSFNSKNFSAQILSKIELESQPYFKKKLLEIKAQYDLLTTEIEWNQLIYKSEYNFKPIIGETYYLYKNDKNNFLSIIHPNEWDLKCIGEFKLGSNSVWEKV